MSSPTRFHQGFITLVLMAILTPHALCKAVKTSARPVHEVINEQSRIDSRTSKTSGFLPYGNPLADNSKQSAILHAANQQAMFHAERVRQHRAQVQRWTKAPIQMDSYMKAYHDSQEKHQIALEQQQTKADAFTPMTPPTVSKSPVRLSRAESKRVIKVLPRPEPTKMTKIEPAPKPNKIRSHRSFGSLNHQYASPKRLQTVYLSPGTTYDQGVTIKPHGNVGLSPFKPSPQSEANTLYTEAIPSHTQYVYPKQYNQMQNYQSAQEIDTLNSLLKIPAHDQLSHLNALIQSSKDGSSLDEGNKDAAIDSPIDLYFYLKDPPASKTLVQHFDQANYAQLPQNYASSYINEAAQPNDHKPIMEDVQDIPDPNVHTKGKNYGLQPVVNDPKIMETTTTKSNNYYKVEVASQTISSGYKSPYYGHDKQPTQYYLSEQGEENKPSYEALKYSSHPSYYEAQDSKLEGDQSERYLHHNAQHLGVQHLNVDGTGVSAYGDEGNVSRAYSYANATAKYFPSTKNRFRRSDPELVTELFVTANNNNTLTTTEIPETILKDNNETARAEPLTLIPHTKTRFGPHNTFLTTPHFQIGEVTDVNIDDDDYYDDFPPPQNGPINHHDKFESYDDGDYESDTDYSTDYDYRRPIPLQPAIRDTNLNYPPIIINQHTDLQGSHSHRRKRRRYPHFSHGINPTTTTYGVPHYGLSESYGSSFQDIGNIHNTLEPVYMLTESQLASIVGQHNLNIEHLDVFQVGKTSHKRPTHRPRKYKKRYPHYGYRTRKINQNLHKLHRLI